MRPLERVGQMSESLVKIAMSWKPNTAWMPGRTMRASSSEFLAWSLMDSGPDRADFLGDARCKGA